MSLPIVIYADGACSGNPGPGGWGSILALPHGKHYAEVIELGGGAANTTNNRMEITAVGKALRHIESKPGDILIFSDSKYVIDGITKWVDGWRVKGWKKADGGEVMNQDFWKRLVALVEAREEKNNIEWRYVKAHSGDPGNDRCDEIAVAYAQGGHETLYTGPYDSYPLKLRLD